MQLYLSAAAPSPRRVKIYLAEKGIDVPRIDVDLSRGEHMRAPYVELNPHRVVPTLVLDDGTVIGESLAICRTFEHLHPEPPLFGTSAREVGLVEMWIRRIEHLGYVPVQDAYRNSRRGFAGRALPGATGDVPQIPQLVERSNAVFARSMDEWDAQLSTSTWFAGERYSMADVMGLTTLDFAIRVKLDAAADLGSHPSLRRWHAEASARPSARA
jgi:glutathione S-transferase